MKSILVLANEDAGLPSRLEAGLALGRAVNGYMTCLQVTPFEAYVASDPFGGVYAFPEVLDQLREREAAHRARVEADLANEGVGWDWRNADGSPAQRLVDHSLLADVIVTTIGGGAADSAELAGVTGTVAMHSGVPTLAVPGKGQPFDPFAPAVVAWNGTSESARALRLATQMLALAASVQVLVVTEETESFPATGVCEYLSRHGVSAELTQLASEGRTVAETLIEAARSLQAGYIVAGAYGHSRVQEAVLGGTTRALLMQSSLPLLIAH